MGDRRAREKTTKEFLPEARHSFFPHQPRPPKRSKAFVLPSSTSTSKAFVLPSSTSTSKKKTKNTQSVAAFPARGGANGSIRFKNEASRPSNKGLDVALKLLEPVAAKHLDVSFSDLFQLAGATAVEVAGGPSICMKYGRRDAPGPESETPEGNLPAGGAPWPKGAAGAAAHLRDVFGRMGLDDGEIVALSGAHTLGRAKPSRSGFGQESTKYTSEVRERLDFNFPPPFFFPFRSTDRKNLDPQNSKTQNKPGSRDARGLLVDAGVAPVG